MRHFYAIVEEGNISNAAKRLTMAQPPLSKQMKQLEEELGVRLFERGSRRIRLTAAGQMFKERVEQILGMVDGTMRDMAEFHSGRGGTLTLGTVTTSGVTLLPDLIRKFHGLYPNVTFQLWEGDGFRILELLDKRIIEVGIIRAPFDSELYEAIMLPDEPLVIAMNRAYCAGGADQPTIRLVELENQPMIVPRRWKAMFVDWCEQAGFHPHIVCVSDGIMLNILWAKLGIGAALVPQSTAGIVADSTLVYRAIVEPAVSTQTAIVWMRNRTLSAAGSHFLALVRELRPAQKD